MKKKILIGCIIAVVILVLVSFTGVVGYQTTKSNSVKVSPLFSVRSKRAINKESKVLNCKYANKEITLSFPERDDKTVMVQKVVDKIRLIDDMTFERFITNIINHAQKNNRLNNIKPDIIREALYMFRDNDKSIPIIDTDARNKYPTGIPSASACCQPYVTFGHGIKGFFDCVRLLLFFVIATINIILIQIPTLFICLVFTLEK